MTEYLTGESDADSIEINDKHIILVVQYIALQSNNVYV